MAWFSVYARTICWTGKGKPSAAPGTTPMLLYGWGNSLNLLRISESKFEQEVKNSKTGKVRKIEVGRIVFEEGKTWTVGGDMLALQWLNTNVGSFIPSLFCVSSVLRGR